MGKALARSRGSPARAISTLPQLRRLLWAVGRLRSGGPLKATDLAREFEVNVRTAYRDLDFLRDEWRVPLEFDRALGTYRLTEPTVALPLVKEEQWKVGRELQLAIYNRAAKALFPDRDVAEAVYYYATATGEYNARPARPRPKSTRP